MTTPTLLLDAALAATLAGLYVFVGGSFSRRPVSTPEALVARRAFTVWWFALAALTLLGAARDLLAGMDVLDLGVHATLAYLSVPPLAAALAGLVYYLLFLHTGASRWLRPTLVAHVALGLFFLGLVAWMRPQGVQVDDWEARIVYANALTGPLLGLVLVLILVPVLAAASAYLGLAFRVDDRTARARIFTVSGAFLLWFGSAGLASAMGWTEWYWWPLVARGIALVSTLLILVAYQPSFPWGARAATRTDPPSGDHERPRRPRALPAGSRQHARRAPARAAPPPSAA